MLRSTLIYFLMLVGFLANAQISAADSLLMDLTSTEKVKSESLLPDRMLITQRMLWGQNGLYRKVGIAPRVLTSETREKELKIRRTMFRLHQGIGLATAGAMIAQGFIGSRLYKEGGKIKELHEGMATGINIGYATTALMSFTAPPPFINRKKFDNIKLHKILSYVHLTGMITTNVLANRIENNYSVNKPLHRAVAFGTFGAYALAIASIKMEF
jgi:hypothetical protein